MALAILAGIAFLAKPDPGASRPIASAALTVPTIPCNTKGGKYVRPTTKQLMVARKALAADLALAARYLRTARPSLIQRRQLRALFKPRYAYFEKTRRSMWLATKRVARPKPSVVKITPKYRPDLVQPCIARSDRRIVFSIDLQETLRSSNGYRSDAKFPWRVALRGKRVVAMTVIVIRTPPVEPPAVSPAAAAGTPHPTNPEDTCDPLEDSECRFDGYVCGNETLTTGGYETPPDDSWQHDFQRALQVFREYAMLVGSPTASSVAIAAKEREVARLVPPYLMRAARSEGQAAKAFGGRVVEVIARGEPWKRLNGDMIPSKGGACYDPVSQRITFVAGMSFRWEFSAGRGGGTGGDFLVIMWRGAIQRII